MKVNVTMKGHASGDSGKLTVDVNVSVLTEDGKRVNDPGRVEQTRRLEARLRNDLAECFARSFMDEVGSWEDEEPSPELN